MYGETVRFMQFREMSVLVLQETLLGQKPKLFKPKRVVDVLTTLPGIS
jgi:hypothetical protein